MTRTASPLLAALLLPIAACATADGPDGARVDATVEVDPWPREVLDGHLTATPSPEWASLGGDGAMRVAQYEVGGPGGEAMLVVFHFEGAGGGVEANFERWRGQFAGEDGGEPGWAELEHPTAGLPTHELHVSGRYVAPLRPGSPELHDEPGWRLQAAIVETPNGPYYLKLTGPEATVLAADPAWRRYLTSLRYVGE